MNIALIGEFSSLQAMLSLGYREHGIETCTFSSGDGFKQISYDKFFGFKGEGYLDLARHLLINQPSMLKDIFSKYDVVQLINPYALLTPNNGRELYAKYLLSSIRSKKRESVFSMLVSGCDANVMPVMESDPRSPCQGCLKDSGLKSCSFAQSSKKKYEDNLIEKLDVIVPFGSAAYAKAYRRSLPPLPFPMTVNSCRNNIIKNKIRVLHGMNRPGFKGSEVISGVFDKLERDYPGVFEFVIPRRLPLEHYLELLMSVNVVVDQMYGGGLGMNALFAMSHGKILMTSYDKKYISQLYGESPPAFPIEHEEMLYRNLKDLISWDSTQFVVMGEKARSFIDRRCNPANVAGNMLEIYKETATS